jgi:hypothetical protein
MVTSLSCQNRKWLIRQTICRAGEFGVCRDLAANLFNYLVVRDLAEFDVMLVTLLEEIVGTRLQFMFEYAISDAISDYRKRNGDRDLKVDLAREYSTKLLHKDMELYNLLK